MSLPAKSEFIAIHNKPELAASLFQSTKLQSRHRSLASILLPLQLGRNLVLNFSEIQVNPLVDWALNVSFF